MREVWVGDGLCACVPDLYVAAGTIKMQIRPVLWRDKGERVSNIETAPSGESFPVLL